MVGVIGQIDGQNLLQRLLRRILRRGFPYGLPDAAAYELPADLHRVGRQAAGRQSAVQGTGYIRDGIQQGTVQIKHNCFYHTSMPPGLRASGTRFRGVL